MQSLVACGGMSQPLMSKLYMKSSPSVEDGVVNSLVVAKCWVPPHRFLRKIFFKRNGHLMSLPLIIFLTYHLANGRSAQAMLK